MTSGDVLEGVAHKFIGQGSDVGEVKVEESCYSKSFGIEEEVIRRYCASNFSVFSHESLENLDKFKSRYRGEN